MARSYRQLGYDDHARTVLLAKERRLHAKGSRMHRLWGLLQDKTIHYGYNPARAGVGFVALAVIGTLFYSLFTLEPLPEAKGGAGDAAARPNPFLYTLDLLIPIANFGQRELWNPTWIQHVVGSVIIVVGWTLAGLAIIGVARRINRP